MYLNTHVQFDILVWLNSYQNIERAQNAMSKTFVPIFLIH